MDAWGRMQNLKGRVAGKLISGFAGAALDLLDPSEQQALQDYGWDNFMKGELPPPFSWLNPDLSGLMPPGTPEKVSQQQPGLPAASYWANPPYYGLRVPVTGVENGQGYAFSPSVLARIVAHNPSPIAVWNPWYFGQAGGARNTPDLLANLGVVGKTSSTFGWNFHEVYGFFSQSPIGVSLKLNLASDSRKSLPFVWTTDVVVSTVSPVDAQNKTEGLLLRTVPSLSGFPAAAAPVAIVPAYSPPWYTWGQLDYANFLKQAAGLQVRDEVTENDWLGAEPGSKTIIPPKGPILTVPGEPIPHPPGANTKEKKARVGSGMFKLAQSLFHGITEYGDAVDAIFEAIPKKDRCKTKSLVGKSWCIFAHLDKVDVGDAIVNLAWNQFEDYVIGTQLFARNQRAAQARNDPYGFRTLNSVNGFGGLEDLGELYGDFSQKYVNPRKDDLKKYLTDKFGI